MVAREHDVTHFDEFVALPENADKRFELIAGEIIEAVSNNLSSEIAASILIALGIFVKQNKLGRVTGANGGYMIGEDRYTPDVAYISYTKQPESSRAAYNPDPSDLVVEVLSQGNKADDISTKVINYMRAGVVVWLINPETQVETIYTTPDAHPEKLEVNGTIKGGEVLPGFELPMKDVFPAEDTPEDNVE